MTLKLDPQTLASCIHCGLCLPACPTYLATGREVESPRGRIYLIAQWQKEQTESDLNHIANQRMAQHLDSCLGCLGCQTACPSGVNYEEIITAARVELASQRKTPLRFLLRFIFKNVLTNDDLLLFSGRMLYLWQKIMGPQPISKFATTLSPHIRNHTFFKPILDKILDFELFTPNVIEHKPLAKATGNFNAVRANLFKGCVMDIFYNHVNQNCINLMAKANQSQAQVVVPEQTCCGALALHAGEEDIARELAWQNINYFENENKNSPDPIVVTSAGCGAMLKSYPHLFKDEKEHKRAEAFSSRVQDISEYLNDKDLGQSTQVNENITYHAACHLAHAQKITTQPLALLSEISNQEGGHLVPLTEAEQCCGSAGIYNLLNTSLSLKVLERKLDHLERTGASVVVTGNPGCMLQLEAGIKKRGLGVRVCHLAEILDESYQ
ncbi:(Fe-S)-binding protein [bacterium]|nr:(Fe-S)-binding protein [bacterium]QQR58674.1 MAG: (Fe-S)-binding protein [Candidatus Melainabacteria bacterium]